MKINKMKEEDGDEEKEDEKDVQKKYEEGDDNE